MFEQIITIIRNVAADIYTNLLVAIIILLTGLVVGRLLGKFVQRLLQELELNKIIWKATNFKISFEELIAKAVTFLVYFTTVIMALAQIGVATTVLNIILIAMLVIIIASILLGFRDFFPNIISGIFIYKERYLREGDKIEIDDMQGKIIRMSLTETSIKTDKGDVIYLPNSILAKKTVKKLKSL